MVSLIRWEVTLKQRNEYEYIDLKMGFVDADHIEHFDLEDRVGYRKHETALWIENNTAPKILANGRNLMMQTNLGSEPTVGDRVRLDFDFEKSEVAAFYNDAAMGVISKELPASVYLAVALYYVDTSFETTLFEGKM